MKKIITIIAVLFFFNVFSQQLISSKVQELNAKEITFKPYSVLTSYIETNTKSINKLVKKSSTAKINFQSVADLVKTKPDNIEIEIPYQGNAIKVQLYKVDLFAEGFHVDTDKAKNIPLEDGIYYRGIVKGDSNSTASFNFFNDEMNGIVSNSTLKNLVITKQNKQAIISDYIIYSDAELNVQNSFECHLVDKPNLVINTNQYKTLQALTTKCVTMYFEIDYNLFVKNSSSESTTNRWIVSVFNNVKTLYANDGINVSLRSVFIWTSPDPYEGIGTSSSDYLYKFNEVRPVFDGDVGQLLGMDPGRLGGVAVDINGLCSQNNFSYSDLDGITFNSWEIYSWTVMVITHEMGHLLGSPHTHACVWNGNGTAIDNCGPKSQGATSEGYECMTNPPTIPDSGTIMSYCHLISGVGIDLTNGFGIQPGAVIRNAINSGPCLSSDCINTCINMVSDIKAEITNSSVSITWSDTNKTNSWLISVETVLSNTLNWIPVSLKAYSLSNLTPNTFYRIRIRPNCGSSMTVDSEQIVFVTSMDYCNGTSLTDSGGASSDYTNLESYVRTIIPSVANKKIKLTFSSFDLETDFDFLYIYDGNSTASTSLKAGGYTGTALPDPIQSSATDGSLTLRFFSDTYVVGAGFVANIECISNLGTNTFVPNIDFTYNPNPSIGMVSIASKTMMSEVFVYNIEGRLLYQNKINTLNTKVDLALFANGTYFFKLKFQDKEANFKIMKQ